MTATYYLVQLPDPDQSPARNLIDGNDTYVVAANSTADAIAMVQNIAKNKVVWAQITPVAIAAATDMTGWTLRVRLYTGDALPVFVGEVDVTATGQTERVVLASGTLSGTGLIAADTVTIGNRTYTIQANLSAGDGHVHFGGNLSTTLTNLTHAINNSGGTPGTDYNVTAADPSVTAVGNATAIVVTALTSLTAAAANTTATTTTAGNVTWGAGNLSGGVDSTNEVSSLAELAVAAINNKGLGVAIAGAAFNNSTHVLTVAAISDAIGDHHISVDLIPPAEYGNSNSETGKSGATGVTSKSIGVPGFVASKVDGGVTGAVLTATLVADSYVIPNIVVKARTQTY